MIVSAYKLFAPGRNIEILQQFQRFVLKVKIKIIILRFFDSISSWLDIKQLISSNTISGNVSSNRLKFTLHLSIRVKRHAFLFLPFSPFTKKRNASYWINEILRAIFIFLYFSREGKDDFYQFLSINVKFSMPSRAPKSDFNDTAHASWTDNTTPNPLTGINNEIL